MYKSYEEVAKFFSQEIVLPGTESEIVVVFPMASFSDIEVPEVNSDFRMGRYILTCIYADADYVVAFITK